MPQVFGHLFGGADLLPVPQFYKHPVQRAGVAAIRLISAKFSIQLTDADVGVSAMIVVNPFELLGGVGVGMG